MFPSSEVDCRIHCSGTDGGRILPQATQSHSEPTIVEAIGYVLPRFLPSFVNHDDDHRSSLTFYHISIPPRPIRKPTNLLRTDCDWIWIDLNLDLDLDLLGHFAISPGFCLHVSYCCYCCLLASISARRKRDQQHRCSTIAAPSPFLSPSQPTKYHKPVEYDT